MTQKKRIDDSRTEQVQIVTGDALNGFGRLFGGRLMEWIDIVAGVVARRHSEKNVTTACVDSLEFHAAAHAGDTVVLSGYITYAGNTSMEICVKTFVEHLDGKRLLINKAYVIMVALGDDEKPTKVPGLIIETQAEKKEYELALLRKNARDKRRSLQN